MSNRHSLAQCVDGYLRFHGWQGLAPGVAGALWVRADDSVTSDYEASAKLAVATELSLGALEWLGLLERLARYEGRAVATVESEIKNFYVDVSRFSASNEHLIDRSIPLPAGVDLITTAQRILRASATTSRNPKREILGGFSKRGDELISLARLAHTEVGSYVLPVLLEISDPEQPKQSDLWIDSATQFERVALEPPERRVTRTLAQALTAVHKLVVTPEISPTSSAIPALVAAGASKELIAALAQSLTQPAVASLKVSFSWAAAIQAPAGVPELVEFPNEAQPLLKQAVKMMTISKKDPTDQFTGPIVEVRHVPEDSYGSVAVQTVRGGRLVEVRVRISEKDVASANDWMRDSQSVVVMGQVERDAARRLWVRNPSSFRSLEQDLLEGA